MNGTVFQEKELLGLPELHNGIFIDLHPIDNTIPCFLRLQVRLTMFWSCVNKVKSRIYDGNRYKKAVYKLFSWLPYRVINAMRNSVMCAFKHCKTQYVYKIAHPNNGVYPITRETFEDLIEHDFEGCTFFIPRRYDEFLSKRYGDYMVIPPEAGIKECCTSIVECKL